MTTSRDPAALLALADADLDALADRLHDGLLQSLVVARYACDAVVGGGDPSVARDAVQQVLVGLRREVWELRPRTGGGLREGLTLLAEQREQARRPPLVLELADVAVAPAVAAVLYRLVQACADVPLTVRLTSTALEFAAPVPDPSAWALRLRAVGADLIGDGTRTHVVLPCMRARATTTDAPTSSDDRTQL